MSHPAYHIINTARAEMEQWAEVSAISIHRFEFVAAFEDWNDAHTLWVFYATDRDLLESNRDGTSEKIKRHYLRILETHDFPFKEFPKVLFKFDSDENVQKNYSGSYFYRLR